MRIWRWTYRTSLILALFLSLPATSGAQEINDDFSRAAGSPAGWVLRTGTGTWARGPGGQRAISVNGNGDDVAYWAKGVPGLKPNAQYALRFRAVASPGASLYTVLGGLDVCNRDFATAQQWTDYEFVFTTPDDVSKAFLRLGQWHLQGTVYFSNVTLTPVTPVHSAFSGLLLGEGEMIRAGRYRFRAPLDGYGSNSSRCLAGHTAPFNTNRWVLTGGLSVTYRHSTGQYEHARATVTATIGYYAGGELVVKASQDGQQWTEIGRAKSSGKHDFPVPGSLLPAREVWIRLEGAARYDPAGDSAPGSFTVEGYEYEADLFGQPPDLSGSTIYAKVRQVAPEASVEITDAGSLGRSDRGVMRLSVRPGTNTTGQIAATLAVRPARTGEEEVFGDSQPIQRGKAVVLHIPFRIRRSGDLVFVLSASHVERSRERKLYEAEIRTYLPHYYAGDYGHSLTPVVDGELWWCESTYKVPPSRQAPTQEFGASLADLQAVKGKGAIQFRAARREREHAQLVFRPTQDPGPIRVAVSDLKGPRQARIPASALEVREVVYLTVTRPTDRTGVAGEWPDALPPLKGLWRPRQGRNNVLWLTVTVPPDAPAGDYSGTLTLAGAKWRREIALTLHVYGFALPEVTRLRSGFEVSPGMIARYHNLRSPEDLARVWDLYMEAFRKRRLNPYNPMALAPYRVELQGAAWTGGTRDATTAASGSYSLRIADDSGTSDFLATYAKPIAVQRGHRYILSWKCRTEKPGQSYMVTVGHLNNHQQWIPYRNNDIVRTGDGEWQAETEDITARIPEDAGFLTVVLRPVTWTETGEKVGVAWFDDVALTAVGPHGIETSLLDDGGFEVEPSLAVKLDFTEFDKAARKYLDGMGFNAFTIHIEGLPGGRYPAFNQGAFLGYRAGTPEYDELMRQYGKQLEDHLAANGWLEKAYVYWYDEPEENDYAIVQEGSRRLKRYFPRLKRMMTEQFEEPLYGHVDLWCPLTAYYDKGKAHARQAMGEEVWWYVCTGPREPYCTLFIDKPAIELRMWLWQTWQHQVQGILIWETTWWTSDAQFGTEQFQNPWEDPMAYVAGPSGVWGNGDGRFFYPPNRNPRTDRNKPYLEGPVDSIRWEMLGEGVEDWEYFHLLESLVRKAEASGRKDEAVQRARRLLTVPASITSDLTHFTADPQQLYRHRDALASAIEALMKAPAPPARRRPAQRALGKAS